MANSTTNVSGTIKIEDDSDFIDTVRRTFLCLPFSQHDSSINISFWVCCKPFGSKSSLQQVSIIAYFVATPLWICSWVQKHFNHGCVLTDACMIIFAHGLCTFVSLGYTNWTESQFKNVGWYLIECFIGAQKQKTNEFLKPTTVRGFILSIPRAIRTIWKHVI